jgi:hypothetical protein
MFADGKISADKFIAEERAEKELEKEALAWNTYYSFTAP